MDLHTIIIMLFVLAFGAVFLAIIRKKEEKKKREKIIRKIGLRARREFTPPKSPEEQLAELGYTFEMIDSIKKEANSKLYYDGKYHSDPNAPYGSPENPEVVGMPDCSDSLQFSLERKHWILTDGLGNGFIR